ncbi:MAG TPA: DUF4296 domain-containing protein [Flavobacterium sp.]|jgi:hypothetical protein
MRKVLSILFLLLAFGCDPTNEKPDNLIGKEKMVDILYDLALLDAIKSQRPIYLEENGINPRNYVYKKYKIDSIQFVKSNQYYSSDFVEYKQIYDEVAKRLESNKLKADPKARADAPQIR